MMIPTCVVPTDGANSRGSASANSMVKDPGLVIEKEQVGRYSSANRRSTSRSIFLREGDISRESKASSRKTRRVDCVLNLFRHLPSQALYTRLGLGESVLDYKDSF